MWTATSFFCLSWLCVEEPMALWEASETWDLMAHSAIIALCFDYSNGWIKQQVISRLFSFSKQQVFASLQTTQQELTFQCENHFNEDKQNYADKSETRFYIRVRGDKCKVKKIASTSVSTNDLITVCILLFPEKIWRAVWADILNYFWQKVSVLDCLSLSKQGVEYDDLEDIGEIK